MPVIAIIITRLNLGGPAKLLMDYLNNSNDDFKYILIHGNCESNEKEFNLNRFKADKYRVKSMARGIRLLKDFQSFIQIRKILKSLDVKLVHTHMSKAGFIGRLAAFSIKSKPIIVHTYHGQLIHGYFNKLKLNLIVKIEQLLSLITDHFIAVSSNTQIELQEIGVGVRKRWTIINPATERKVYRRKHSNILRLIWVGRFEKVKNPQLAINSIVALRKLAPKLKVNLQMYGDGTLLMECKKFSQKQNLPIEFYGWTEDLGPVYSNATLLLLTSLNEGFGLVALEAASYGVPTIATKNGGIEDLIDSGKNGVLVMANSKDISSQIFELAKNKKYLTRLSLQAIKIANKKFSIERYINDHRRLYEKLIQNEI